MKNALVVLLVVVVLVTGLPVLVGMSGMASCPDCGPAVVVGATCVAILAAGVALILALLVQRLRRSADAVRLLLHPFLLDRPPRLA